MKDKDVAAAMIASLSNMFGCDGNCENCNNNRSHKDDVILMIDETHKIVSIVKEHAFTEESVEVMSCIVKNAILFDEEDAKIVGKELTEQFKNDLRVVHQSLLSGLDMNINKIRGFIKQFDKPIDDLENKTKEELIAMLRNK